MEVRFVDGQVEQYEDEPSFYGGQAVLHYSQDKQNLLKIYTDGISAQEHIVRIDKVIEELKHVRSDPYWDAFFTFPEKRLVKLTRIDPATKKQVVSSPAGFRMRYVSGMKLMETYFLEKPFKRLPPEARGWFIGRLASAIKLVSAANRLAKVGLCYADFSGKNVMVDPFAGTAVLIDCDNLTVEGKLDAAVGGTPEFRAPELTSGDIKVPNLQTDRHALAVLLYRWFLFFHPLFGDRSYANDADQDDLLRYGKMATYIEHPTDTTNYASSQTIKASMLGKEMANLFQAAFVDGLRNPAKRPRPERWLRALYHLYDQIIPCATPDCWWHFFIAQPGEPLICPACKEPLKQPIELPFVYLLGHDRGGDPFSYRQGEAQSDHYLAGWPGRELYQWHVRPEAHPEYANASQIPSIAPWATFALDQQAAHWSLKNLSSQSMYYQLPGDTSPREWRTWLPNEHIWLISGMQLQFGPAPVFYRALVRLEPTN